MISITIPGSPIALKRHRTAKTGHRYDPSENDKADFLAKCMAKRPDKPFTGPVQLDATFYFQRPKSHYRTGKYSGELKPNAPYWHISRPDKDNCEKMIADAFEGVYFRNDSQICSGTTSKIYSETPRVEIKIQELNAKS